MARRYTATTDATNCGSAASLDNINLGTVAAWVTMSSLVTTARLVYKDNGAGGAIHALFISGTTGNVRHAIQGGTLFDKITSDTPLVVGIPTFLASVFNVGTSGSWYASPLGQRLLLRTLGTDVNGATPADDAAGSLFVGNNSTPNLPLSGTIHWIGIWRRILTYSELCDLQAFTAWLSGLSLIKPPVFAPLWADSVIYMLPGQGGADVDYSPQRNNGVSTGATIVNPIPTTEPFPWIGTRQIGF